MDIVFEPDPVLTPIMILTGGPTATDLAAVGIISLVRWTGGGRSLLEYNTMTPYKCTRTPEQRAAMLRERAEADNNWCNCGGYGPCASRGGEFSNPGCTGYPMMRTAVVAWLDHVKGWEVGGILSHIAMVMKKGNNNSRTVATGIRAFIEDPAVQEVMRDIDTGRVQLGVRAPLGVQGPLLGMLGIESEDDVVMSVYDLCWAAGIRPVLVGLALEWSAPTGSTIDRRRRVYADPISGPFHHLLCKLQREYSDRSTSSWGHHVLFSLLTANIFNAVERAVAPTKSIWDCWRPTFADAAMFRSWTSGAGAAGAPGCRSTARGGGSCVNHHVECGAMAMLREPLTDGGGNASKSAFDVWPREIRDAVARRTCSYARDWEPATAIRVRLAESSRYHARGAEVECKCDTSPPTSDDAEKFLRDVWSRSLSCTAPRSGRASELTSTFPDLPDWHKGRSPLAVVVDARTTLGRHEPHSGCGIERVSPPDPPPPQPSRSPSPRRRRHVDWDDTD
ncbi:hypothetical protein PCL_01201 [Purpureocillium lilacinum]|uniref:Uncharacterized protein n=1 Tax=Purpureocillium lilacinum TaxID=33203 RepID=A0A2U3DP14_PURLI|nr:hypothetical protein PCL_01201 [Purpureocillium lilacinum]